LLALDPTLDLARVREVLEARYRPDYVHEQPLDRKETWRTRALAPVAFARRAWAGVRARLRSR
jgi:hypothetical protein